MSFIEYVYINWFNFRWHRFHSAYRSVRNWLTLESAMHKEVCSRYVAICLPSTFVVCMFTQHLVGTGSGTCALLNGQVIFGPHVIYAPKCRPDSFRVLFAVRVQRMCWYVYGMRVRYASGSKHIYYISQKFENTHAHRTNALTHQKRS